MENLTIKEALSQGYTKCGDNKKEWQTLDDISELGKEDFVDRDIVLAEKESFSPSISEDKIKELLADYISDEWYERCPDDTDEVYNKVSEVDVTDVTKRINENLSDKKAWMLTSIKLTP